MSRITPRIKSKTRRAKQGALYAQDARDLHDHGNVRVIMISMLSKQKMLLVEHEKLSRRIASLNLRNSVITNRLTILEGILFEADTTKKND